MRTIFSHMEKQYWNIKEVYMNRLIVRGEPVGPFQYISVFVDDQRVDSLGVQFEDLEELVFAYIEKYNIKHIDLSGARGYMEGIEEKLKRTAVETYSLDDLTFRYV